MRCKFGKVKSGPRKGRCRKRRVTRRHCAEKVVTSRGVRCARYSRGRGYGRPYGPWMQR